MTDPKWPIDTEGLTPELVRSMSYTDFVALINQTNVPPGAHVALTKWILGSGLGKDADLLEVACTTGFNSRELAQRTGCKVTGFDLSEDSVKVAQFNHQWHAPEIDATYFQADGMVWQPSQRYSHIVVGASLGFFPDPSKAAERVTGWLEDGGFLLAGAFYANDPLPAELEAKRRSYFGLVTPMRDYRHERNLFRGLEMLYEDKQSSEPETPGELAHYCMSTIDRACVLGGVEDEEVRDAMYARLLDVKTVANELRAASNYATLVMRYKASVYPARYTELF